MVQVLSLVTCCEAGLLWPTMCPTSWYRFFPIIILNKMLYIRSSSCNIEHHHRLRRQKLSIIRYQPNDSGIRVAHALYHCVFPAKNSRNQHVAPLPSKVSRINCLTFTVVSQFGSNLNASATDSDTCNRSHRLVIATCAQSLTVSDTRLIIPNIVKSDTSTRCMICDKVLFGITNRLLVVDDFNGELAEVSCVCGPGISS